MPWARAAQVHNATGLRACSISYEQAIGAPVVIDKVVETGSNGKEATVMHVERVRCVDEYLGHAQQQHASGPRGKDKGGKAAAAGGTGRGGGGGSNASHIPPVIHLKASQRYPTHEYAFSLLHDCLSAAESAHLRATPAARGGNRTLIGQQALWAHGLSRRLAGDD